MSTGRAAVTEKIMTSKVLNDITWTHVASQTNKSPTWTAAACLGQATMDEAEATKIGEIFSLNKDDIKWLQVVPTRDGPTKVPTDPLLYRLHEALGVYGPALKEVIHEEFGDGIMSAIDFNVTMEREPNPAGDRVKMIWSGKFLPYKKF